MIHAARFLLCGALPAALFALAACGEPAENSEIPPDPELREEQSLPQPPAEDIPAGPAAEDAVNAATPEDLPDVTDGRIPGDFQGEWALAPGDCEPGASDAKGLMTVAGDRITFNESRARVTNLSATAANELTADLAFTREGQEWTRRTVLRLEDAGKTLMRSDQEMEPLAYKRCADIALSE